MIEAFAPQIGPARNNSHCIAGPRYVRNRVAEVLGISGRVTCNEDERTASVTQRSDNPTGNGIGMHRACNVIRPRSCWGESVEGEVLGHLACSKRNTQGI